MNVMWIVAGIGIGGTLAKLLASLRDRGGEKDLGCVSHQWILEHRATIPTGAR